LPRERILSEMREAYWFHIYQAEVLESVIEAGGGNVGERPSEIDLRKLDKSCTRSSGRTSLGVLGRSGLEDAILKKNKRRRGCGAGNEVFIDPEGNSDEFRKRLVGALQDMEKHRMWISVRIFLGIMVGGGENFVSVHESLSKSGVDSVQGVAHVVSNKCRGAGLRYADVVMSTGGPPSVVDEEGTERCLRRYRLSKVALPVVRDFLGAISTTS